MAIQFVAKAEYTVRFDDGTAVVYDEYHTAFMAALKHGGKLTGRSKLRAANPYWVDYARTNGWRFAA